MNEIREKLARMLHDLNCPCGEGVAASTFDKQYMRKADAILAKFDVSEKKPRYYVSGLCVMRRLYPDSAGTAISVLAVHQHSGQCAITPEELCDWLNSREESK